MRDSSCRREDIITAFDELSRRLEDRAASLWSSYGEATRELGSQDYLEQERECWHVLEASLAGVDAERRMLETDYRERLAMVDDTEAVA